jgi:hypothetical protein
MVNHKERDMEKTNILLLVLAFFLAMQTQANAASNGRNADRCALPDGAIGVVVLHAADPEETRRGFRTRQKRLVNDATMLDRPAACTDTTQVATVAFGSVLARIGMPVGWDYRPPDPTDFCPSYYLSQCYPRPVSDYPAASASQLALLSRKSPGAALK